MGTPLVTGRKARQILQKEAMRRDATVLPYSPFTIYIDPCNACDLRCTFCPQSNWGERRRGVMSWELFERLLPELVELNPRYVNLFCYGESLLHKRIFDMVAAVAERGLNTRIHTNAKTLDEEKSKKLLDAGLTSLNFSFDTADADDYNRMRVRSDFDLVLGNMRRFLQLKKEGGYELPHVFAQELVPYRKGQDPQNTPEYRALFEGYDVHLTARHMHNFAGASLEKDFATRQAEGFSQCTELYTRIVVTFDGKLHACCLDAEGYNIVGDLTQGDTIASSWNGPVMQELRRRTNARDVAGLKPCETCDVIRRSQKKGPRPHERLIGSALWKLRAPEVEAEVRARAERAKTLTPRPPPAQPGSQAPEKAASRAD